MNDQPVVIWSHLGQSAMIDLMLFLTRVNIHMCELLIPLGCSPIVVSSLHTQAELEHD